ncbi:unnamed protein product, partial [Ectocarpus sp. 12 AP-2014]
GAVKVQPRRRKSTSLDGERRGEGAQQREVGYPMTSVAAVLRQLHMRVLSVEEMKMLDQVTGEGIAEHLVEMRTILEDQKRRLEMKIRSMHDVFSDSNSQHQQRPQPPNGVVVVGQGRLDSTLPPSPSKPAVVVRAAGAAPVDAAATAPAAVTVAAVAAGVAGENTAQTGGRSTPMAQEGDKAAPAAAACQEGGANTCSG